MNEMSENTDIISLMIQHHAGDPMKIHHMMKVYAFARTISIEEGIDKPTRQIIEMAALIYDIGIGGDGRATTEARSNGLDGSSISDMLLLNLGYERDVIQRVHNLILSHSQFESIETMDYQILAESIFLVTAHEEKLDKESIVEVYDTVFKTATGKQYLRDMYSIRDRRK